MRDQLGIKHIKLPRKRKKEYLKTHTRGDYLVVRILASLLLEENPRKGLHRFPKYKQVGHATYVKIGRW